jgi:hypothetical protein
MKLVKLDTHYWPRGGYGHWCPGCKSGHEIDTEQPNGSGAKWGFNGNLERPTFTPSINRRWGTFADPNYKPEPGHDHSGVCHYFITDGKIIYCGDCTHALKGQTVDLPDIPEGKYATSIWMASR